MSKETEEENNQSMQFILDWQKRSAAQQKTFLGVLIATLIIALAICEMGFIWFQNNNYERTIEHNMNYVQDSALQEAHYIEQNMSQTVRVVETLATQYVYLEDRFPESTIEDRLRIMWDGTVFDRVAYIAPDGSDTSLEGLANVSDRHYFQRAIAGQSGYQFIENSRVTGQSSMVFYAPIYRDGEISGVMVGFQESARIDRQLTFKFLNYIPKIYLLRGDGLVIGSSNDMHLLENMFDILAERSYRGESNYAAIRSTIDDENSKTLTFTLIDEGRSSIGVVAQFEDNNEMLVLSVLPSEITDAMIQEADSAGRRLMLTMSGAFIVLIAVFFVFIIRQLRRTKAEMTLATDNLVKTRAHDQRQSFIVESLSNTYSSVYYVDLKSLQYERIAESNDGVKQKIQDIGSWKTAYPVFLERFVDKADQEKMRGFGCPDACAKLLEQGEQMEIEYRRPDAKWRKAIMIPAEHDETGAITSVILAVQSIDESKRRELDTKKALEEAYEAAMLASNAKTTFLSNISHDIRTPMNAIVGMTAIAGANLDNRDKIADCLKKISIASRHLLGIINEVLDMSKIETGKIDLSEEAFRLPDLFDELISINRPLIQEKNHSLSVNVSALEHENVIGDSVRLQQVFTNLLTNAIKYTPAGGKLEIVVSEKNTNKPNVGWYEVTFRDNGIGMSEDFQKRMFEPFSRAKDRRIAGIAGTGLGMPIARNIIRMMNGDIKVESRINQGSTFTVSFALKIQSGDALDLAHFADLPVLVVDDDLVSCESTCGMLRSLSMRSEYVLSGGEAIEKAAQRHENHDDYYAVIVDWQMPDMNGIETARELRRRIGNDVPIIVISAYDWSEIEPDARAAGVNAFLSKPLFRSRLVTLFTELTKKSEPESVSRENELREQDFSGKHILLAEDNEMNREIAVEIFGMMGLETDTAENGRLCLEKFLASEPGRYDLIFMDIQMPEMDGYQAAAAIRAASHPQAKTIPIVAMSANAFSTDVRNAINSGMNGHVSKPIDIPAIIKVLKETLG